MEAKPDVGAGMGPNSCSASVRIGGGMKIEIRKSPRVYFVSVEDTVILILNDN